MLAIWMLAWVPLVLWPGWLCPPSSQEQSSPLPLPGTALLFTLSQPPPQPLVEGGFCNFVRMD